MSIVPPRAYEKRHLLGEKGYDEEARPATKCVVSDANTNDSAAAAEAH
jgi:hypothetical protein